MLWPHSFSAIAPDCSQITVMHIGDTLEHPVTEWKVESGSEEYAAIRAVLDRYSYHRTWQTFTGDTSLNGNHAGYWLYMYLDTVEDRNVILCGGTGKIQINDCVYRIGYFGDDASLSMMKEIIDVLDS